MIASPKFAKQYGYSALANSSAKALGGPEGFFFLSRSLLSRTGCAPIGALVIAVRRRSLSWLPAIPLPAAALMPVGAPALLLPLLLLLLPPLLLLPLLI